MTHTFLCNYAHLIVVVPNGCHIWIGAERGYGYGGMTFGGVGYYTHRLSYEWEYGSVPPGLHIDHLCRTRACCNPEHLEAVTQLENTRRGGNTIKTHCKRGHEFTSENTYCQRGTAKRSCNICRRDASTRANARRRSK